MGEALDHTLHGFLGTVRIARNLVAHLDDGSPVLRGGVLIRRLGWKGKAVSACFESLQIVWMIGTKRTDDIVERPCRSGSKHGAQQAITGAAMVTGDATAVGSREDVK